ncbi:MAG: ABC transporter permease [Candidatus Thermoplasmatota archaeon]|jgi:ABC-2 type transport system permease protein|nr:ABC transporter permease [Candidatus Thermoplasmatota archaeon]
MDINQYIPDIDDLKNMYLTIKFEMLKHIKRKRILITLILAILIPLIFFIVPPILGHDYADTANSFAASNLGFVNLLIILSGAIFTGDSISGEFENKTGLLLFPTPQRKSSIFIGKYIASLFATWLIVSLYYLITVMEMVSIYGISGISLEIAQSFLIALLYSVSVVSIVFFFSSIMKKTITSTLIGFFLLLMILPIITAVFIVAEVDPWFILTHNNSLITDVLRTANGNGLGSDQRFNFLTFQPDLWTGIGVMSAYAIVLFLIGIVMANRRKME